MHGSRRRPPGARSATRWPRRSTRSPSTATRAPTTPCSSSRAARSSADARRVARAMGDSMLCKAAFHGGDPNWGRFVMAAGNAGVPIDQTRVDVTIGGVAVARRGRPLPRALARARRRMRAREFTIALDLHLGRGEGRILAADLSVAYVRFNAEYTT